VNGMKTLEEFALENPHAAVASCPVGTRIFFAEEKSPYRVRARSDRYLVCTKPFNPKRTVFYTIIDLVEQVRGPENLVFGFGAETDEQCVEMVERLHAITKPETPKATAEIKAAPRDVRRMLKPTYSGPTEVSHRHRIPLSISKITLPA
jgi:hypothetical protein